MTGLAGGWLVVDITQPSLPASSPSSCVAEGNAHLHEGQTEYSPDPRIPCSAGLADAAGGRVRHGRAGGVDQSGRTGQGSGGEVGVRVTLHAALDGVVIDCPWLPPPSTTTIRADGSSLCASCAPA